MKKIIKLTETQLIFTIEKVIKETLSLNDKVGNFTIISDLKGHQGRKLGNWQSDNAWDLGGPVGTPVYSYTNGIVSKVYTSNDNDKRFGTQVTVLGSGGDPDIFYTHLKDVNLKNGQKIKVGDLIGKITYWKKYPNLSHVHIGVEKGYDLSNLINRQNNGNEDLKTKEINQLKTEPKIKSKILRQGSKGEDVKKLQRALDIEDDGIFGKLTKLKVIQFQSKNNLTPDGIVGPKTQKKIFGDL